MHKNYKYMCNETDNLYNVKGTCSCEKQHQGGYQGYCEKYEREAQREMQEANNLKKHADCVKYEAECLEKEVMKMVQRAKRMWEESEMAWEKYDHMSREIMKLQNDAIQNLNKYIGCEEGVRPNPPCHGCGGCNCGCK